MKVLLRTFFKQGIYDVALVKNKEVEIEGKQQNEDLCQYAWKVPQFEETFKEGHRI